MSDVRVHSAGGVAVTQLLLDDFGILGLRDADPVRDAKDVTIDRQTGHAERMAEHDVRGLATNARQLHQFVHRSRDLAVVGFDDFGRHAEERPGLGAEKAGRLDLRLQLARGRAREDAARSGYRLKSAGVTWLTRSSVHCAERIVATSSS